MKAKTVIIVWASSAAAAAEGNLSRLAYGNGDARVYDRDAYDPRIDLGRDRGQDGPVPFFTNVLAALWWCGEHPRQPCQVQVEGPRGARRAGLL